MPQRLLQDPIVFTCYRNYSGQIRTSGKDTCLIGVQAKTSNITHTTRALSLCWKFIREESIFVKI